MRMIDVRNEIGKGSTQAFSSQIQYLSESTNITTNTETAMLSKQKWWWKWGWQQWDHHDLDYVSEYIERYSVSSPDRWVRSTYQNC